MHFSVTQKKAEKGNRKTTYFLVISLYVMPWYAQNIFIFRFNRDLTVSAGDFRPTLGQLLAFLLCSFLNTVFVCYKALQEGRNIRDHSLRFDALFSFLFFFSFCLWLFWNLGILCLQVILSDFCIVFSYCSVLFGDEICNTEN